MPLFNGTSLFCYWKKNPPRQMRVFLSPKTWVQFLNPKGDTIYIQQLFRGPGDATKQCVSGIHKLVLVSSQTFYKSKIQSSRSSQCGRAGVKEDSLDCRSDTNFVILTRSSVGGSRLGLAGVIINGVFLCNIKLSYCSISIGLPWSC